MIRTTLSIILIAIVPSACLQEEDQQVDICIYGATSAGIIAAYSAVKMGKSVVVIAQSQHVGGLTTGGLGYTDIGNKYAITGLAKDFYRRLGSRYEQFEQWIFEPHIASAVFDEYIDQADIEILYDFDIISASVEGRSIKSVTVESSNGGPKKQIKAKIFIDASYEGDLMAAAGVSYVTGREANSQYNETYNGVQLMTGHQFPEGVDPYVIPGDPESGLLWGVSDGRLGEQGSGDAKLQAYNFRICLTDDPSNRVEITRPDNYDSTRYELLIRLFARQPDKRSLNDYMIWSRMPNHKTDINNRGGFSTDMIGMNYEYPEAGPQQRKEIVKAHEDYTKGLLFFFKTDPRVPAGLRDEMQAWGYPRDEYVMNEHWSPQLYVREVRRMVGAYVMTQANCQGREVVDDGIAMAAYTMDSHNCQRIVIEKEGQAMVKNEGNVEIGGFGPYPISYRSITPQADQCNNLLVPVCLSATHIAYGSIRMEPVFMALAQSSAIAASMAIDSGVSVQEVDAGKIQSVLKRDPLLNGSTPEIIVDNDNPSRVAVQGEWTVATDGAFGPTLLTDNSPGLKSARFTPAISTSATYSVYVYYLPKPGASSTTALKIFDGRMVKDTLINKSRVVVEGQTSGKFVYVGDYQLDAGDGSYVEISNANADGTVVADAVLWVPKE